MKILDKLLIPILIVSFFIAYNEVTKPDKNIFILIISIFLFTIGMIKLSSKTPTKNPDKNNDDI